MPNPVATCHRNSFFYVKLLFHANGNCSCLRYVSISPSNESYGDSNAYVKSWMPTKPSFPAYGPTIVKGPRYIVKSCNTPIDSNGISSVLYSVGL